MTTLRLNELTLSPTSLIFSPLMIPIPQTLQTWTVLQQFLKPPESESQYLELLEFINQLSDQHNTLDKPTNSLFILACGYAQQWEEIHEPPVPDSTPLEHLRALMTERNVSQYQLQKAGVVKQAVISRILRGEREISKTLARALGEYFGVVYKIFL